MGERITGLFTRDGERDCSSRSGLNASLTLDDVDRRDVRHQSVSSALWCPSSICSPEDHSLARCVPVHTQGLQHTEFGEPPSFFFFLKGDVIGWA